MVIELIADRNQIWSVPARVRVMAAEPRFSMISRAPVLPAIPGNVQVAAEEPEKT